jgi:prepilin signal peptidase PulO-like enzyme (type II secretory pathway)
MNKVIKSSSWLGILFFTGAVLCMVAYNMIGQEVDAQGVLQEPFFLIPLFWLFLALSIITGVVNIVSRIIRARSTKTASQ